MTLALISYPRYVSPYQQDPASGYEFEDSRSHHDSPCSHGHTDKDGEDVGPAAFYDESSEVEMNQLAAASRRRHAEQDRFRGHSVTTDTFARAGSPGLDTAIAEAGLLGALGSSIAGAAGAGGGTGAS